MYCTCIVIPLLDVFGLILVHQLCVHVHVFAAVITLYVAYYIQYASRQDKYMYMYLVLYIVDCM